MNDETLINPSLYFVDGHNIVIQHKLSNRHNVRVSYELQREHEILHQPTQKDNTKKTRQTIKTKAYIGVTVNEFKTRFRNHTKPINNKKISKRDRTFQIHLATEGQQPTTQDQVRNHQENPARQTQPEEMWSVPRRETTDFKRTKQKKIK